MNSQSTSRKRPSPDSNTDALYIGGIRTGSILTPETSSSQPQPKRRRFSPLNSSASTLSKSNSDHDTSTNGEDYPDTPLSSAHPPVPTMALSLTIPHEEPSPGEQRRLTNRANAAQRWKTKLKRPFPTQTEINTAYNMKLMRHYPGTILTRQEPNFIKPKIDTSPRVDHLLKRFPLLSTPGSNQPSMPQGPVMLVANNKDLQRNKAITKTEDAQRWAWKNFSTPETGRIDRGREAMMESGLEVEDMANEEYGKMNGLPEWRKKSTGKFVKERVVIDLTGDDD